MGIKVRRKKVSNGVNPITLILLGDIAAGKDTQAALLERRYKLKVVSTGSFPRKYWTGNSKVSRRLEKTKLGKLTPSDIIKTFLRKSLSNLPKRQNVLLNGGKMPSEAVLIHKLLKKQGRKILVIYLTLPHEEIYRRLTGRYYCQRTGKPVTLKKPSNICPHCGGPLIKRADDEPRSVRNRIKYYDDVYSKTVKFWSGKKMLRKIDGRASIPAVTKAILEAISKYHGAH